MTQNTIAYKDIEKILLTKFPELDELVRKNFGSYYDLKTETPEAYPIFEDVLQGFLFNLLDTDKNRPLLRRIFSFLEKMAESQDKEVVNLLWIAILESLVFRRDRIRCAWKYMGERTKELAKETARSGGWQENLPPEEANPAGGH